jgi:hypothetical protein
MLKSADRCAHRHSCLDTGKCGDQTMCSVGHVFGIVFLQTELPAQCTYRVMSDGKQMCMCPVRSFIAETYGD